MKIELESKDLIELCTPNSRGEAFADAIIDEEYIGFRPGAACVLTFVVGVTAKKVLFQLMEQSPNSIHWVRVDADLAKALVPLPNTKRTARKAQGEKTNPKITLQSPMSWPDRPDKI